MDAGTTISSGARIGNYVLDEAVGAGAFAQVWKAHHHERPGRTVAVKIAVEPEFRRQLRREGRLPDISHPNLVPIGDSDTTHDPPYLVMPYYSGGSMADLIKQHSSGLPEDRVEQLLKDILSGLAELHGRGIVHRDLKPSNILLDEHGRAAIADFGLWHGGDGEGALRSMQQSLSVSVDGRTNLAGTIAYMAPEVLDGEEATTAADVYAIGLILFEMLVGRRPRGIELPGRQATKLGRKALWDALYYWSTLGTDSRYANAAAVKSAWLKGPAPMPFQDQAMSAIPETPPLTPPQLSGDTWDDLIPIWDQHEQAHASLTDMRCKIDTALTMYVESHPEVRNLRAQEAAIESRLAQTKEQCICLASFGLGYRASAWAGEGVRRILDRSVSASMAFCRQVANREARTSSA